MVNIFRCYLLLIRYAPENKGRPHEPVSGESSIYKCHVFVIRSIYFITYLEGKITDSLTFDSKISMRISGPLETCHSHLLIRIKVTTGVEYIRLIPRHIRLEGDRCLAIIIKWLQQTGFAFNCSHHLIFVHALIAHRWSK